MTLSEQLDQILLAGANGELIVAHFGHTDVYVQAVRLGVSFGLLVQKLETYQYELTQRAYEVIETGGFEAWKSVNQARQDEAHRATVDAAKSASSSARAAWFSGVLGAVAVIVSLYQLDKGADTDTRLNAALKRVESVDSLMRVLQQNQTTSGRAGYHVSPDSLVRSTGRASVMPKSSPGTNR